MQSAGWLHNAAQDFSELPKQIFTGSKWHRQSVTRQLREALVACPLPVFNLMCCSCTAKMAP